MMILTIKYAAKNADTASGFCFAIPLSQNRLAIKKGGFCMNSVEISLSSINSVKDFVNIVNKYDYDIDLSSGRYVVDAKSIMGIFSLDLSKPIKMTAHTDDAAALMEEVKPFII
jgi:phosphocarrier protein HPr